MFASMFKSLFNKSEKKTKKYKIPSVKDEITKQDIENMLTELDNANKNSDDESICSLFDEANEAFDLLSITDSEISNVEVLVDNFDNISDISSIGEIKHVPIEDPSKQKLVNQINSLQCLFTWNLKSNKKNIISFITNKYGEYNLDISLSEFTFERYIGNLIIGYELFHEDKIEIAQLKILEVGKWLEELNNGTDEFYLSINTGLKHVMTGTFIHMLYASNLIEECKWLVEDIMEQSFANMDFKSRAAVHAVRAAVLIEFGGNSIYFKKACEYAKKACDLDPNTSYWFYIYSLALTAQRYFLQSRKSSPTEKEINAIQQAILLSDGKNTLYNYHRMILDRDTIIKNFHSNKDKNDKTVYEKNIQENKIILQMIKTIISMEPKDPLLIVRCADIIIKLPFKVRDFKLGKQYLTKALQMAPSDVVVLKAVENVVELYKVASKINVKKTIKSEKFQPQSNKKSSLGEELGLIVTKYRRGEDPIPYLTDMTEKYKGFNKCKIMAQICSYNILFNNSLKDGINQFIWLSEQPNLVNNFLITKHYSSFGSKNFNLAELVCNEIRLATNSSISTEDMLFYFKMLSKIVERHNLKLKDVDPSMKTNLIINSSCASSCSNSKNQYENNSFDSESDVDDKTKNNITTKHRTKNINYKVFHKSNNKISKKNDTSDKNVSKNTKYKMQQTNVSNIDELKSKMSKFNSTSANNTSFLTMENLRNLKTAEEINKCSQQLYQNLKLTQGQLISHNQTSQVPNLFSSQNQGNMMSSLLQQQFPFQNPHPIPLLSLRPQINQRNTQSSTKHEKKNYYSKKK